MRAKGKFPFSDFMLIINQLEIAISLNFDEDSVRLIRLYTMSSPRRSFKPTLINHIFYLLWFPIGKCMYFVIFEGFKGSMSPNNL